MRATLALFVLCTSALAAPVPKELRKPKYEGAWKVEFANGVIESCSIEKNGKTALVEPLRRAGGRADVFSSGVLIIAFDDDRTERWTPDGNRYTVEHWFPSSQFPKAIPVIGIAERSH